MPTVVPRCQEGCGIDTLSSAQDTRALPNVEMAAMGGQIQAECPCAPDSNVRSQTDSLSRTVARRRRSTDSRRAGPAERTAFAPAPSELPDQHKGAHALRSVSTAEPRSLILDRATSLVDYLMVYGRNWRSPPGRCRTATSSGSTTCQPTRLPVWCLNGRQQLVAVGLQSWVWTTTRFSGCCSMPWDNITPPPRSERIPSSR